MKRTMLLAFAASLALAATGAQAASINDATGDWAVGYTGPFESDLDVTSFSASWNAATGFFDLAGTFAGDIDPTLPGFYVIGANTGTGANHPFGPQGAPNVVFNQVIILQKTGAATIGGHPPLTGTIAGNRFTLDIPLADLPSTGFTNPYNYAFNLWPRSGTNLIADFAPNNSDLVAVPEPGVWAMMVVGVGLIGTAMRRRRALQLVAA
jgi:hypothetical protein